MVDAEDRNEKKALLGGKKKVLLASGLAICLLALALGLGLGLGLKHRTSNNTVLQVETPTPIVSWRRNPQDYILSNSFDINAAATTRQFTLNLTEIPDGAPDGVLRRLLLINGQFPGPVIEANEGDRLEVQVNNFMTLPAAIHWHGQYQNGMPSAVIF
jgi:FtsP/CotA-like multicopper oxidase with cupredoxin domain